MCGVRGGARRATPRARPAPRPRAPFVKELRDRVARRKRAGLFRARAIADDDSAISFCSNDYLGMAADPRVAAAFKRGVDEYGAGAGASSLAGGYTRAHRELELAVAEFAGRDRALLFSTGYMANLGALGTLAGRRAPVFEDRLNHASLLDAATLARADLRRYPHLDIDALEAALPAGAVVATDAVFSMDGDVAPLERLARLCGARGATLLLDEAHSLGVFGPRGAGLARQLALSQREAPVLVGTFGKAFGTFGAFVAGDEDLIEALIQFARSYAYTTAPPPALACATLESLRLVAAADDRRARLLRNVAHFRALARAAELPCLASATPVQGVLAGGAERAAALGRRLLRDGLRVAAIRPPTVPAGGARLRVTLSSAHTPEAIERLVEALARGLRELPAVK